MSPLRLVVAAAVVGAASAAIARVRVDKLSNPPGGYVKVYCSMLTNSIRQLNSASSTFSISSNPQFAWQDDRLASLDDGSDYISGAKSLGSKAPFTEAHSYANIVQTSVDQTTYLISKGAPNFVLSVTGKPVNLTETWVVGVSLLSGTMLQSQALQNFPFDKQNAGVQLVSSSWDSGSLEWVNVPGDDDLLLPATIDGWTIVSSSTTVDSVNVIIRFVQPLCLVVTMTLVAMYAFPVSSPPRLALPAASFGSTISFIFIASASLPQLPYPTKLDQFFSLCFYISFFAFVFNTALHLFAERLKGQIKESKDSNKGRAVWCLFSRPSPVLKEAPATDAAPAAAPAAAGDAAKPKPVKGVWNTFLADWPNTTDYVVATALLLTFAVGTAVILGIAKSQ